MVAGILAAILAACGSGSEELPTQAGGDATEPTPLSVSNETAVPTTAEATAAGSYVGEFTYSLGLPVLIEWDLTVVETRVDNSLSPVGEAAVNATLDGTVSFSRPLEGRDMRVLSSAASDDAAIFPLDSPSGNGTRFLPLWRPTQLRDGASATVPAGTAWVERFAGTIVSPSLEESEAAELAEGLENGTIPLRIRLEDLKVDGPTSLPNIDVDRTGVLSVECAQPLPGCS